MSTDELIGIYAASRILGVSPQRADQLSRQTGFPEPEATVVAEGLTPRRKWLRSAVEAWAAARKPTTTAEAEQ